MGNTVDRVSDVVEMLHTAWMDAMQLQTSRRMWDRLGLALEGYGRAAWYLHSWHVDAALAGCRRLLDPRQDVTSLTRALVDLGRVVPSLTAPVLAEAWRHIGRVPDAPELVEQAGEAIIRAAGDAPDGVVTRRMVTHDRERLGRDHGRVLEMANQRVAHRPRERDRDMVVSFAELDALILDVLQVAQRWAGLTVGTHLSIHDFDDGDVEPVALALELFDHGRYLDALEQAEIEIGPAAPAETYDRVRRGVTLRYVFPTNE